MRRLLLLSFMMLLLARPALADDYADGIAAIKIKDYPKALMLLRPLADAGNVPAMKQVGLLYYKGYGIKKDDPTALKYFLAAADKGAVEDQITVALFYQHDGIEAKDLGMPGTLGTATQDFTEARKWFYKAMAQSSAEAVRRVGDMYQKGWGVEQDYKLAAMWYTKAAEAGEADAQYELGLLCKKGLGVQTDLIEAYKWLTLAANQDFKTAAEQRDFMAKGMTADDIKAAMQKVTAWKKTPIPQGFAGPPPPPPRKPAADAEPAAATAATPAAAPAEPQQPAPAQIQTSDPDPNSAPAPGQH